MKNSKPGHQAICIMSTQVAFHHATLTRVMVFCVIFPRITKMMDNYPNLLHQLHRRGRSQGLRGFVPSKLIWNNQVLGHFVLCRWWWWWWVFKDDSFLDWESILVWVTWSTLFARTINLTTTFWMLYSLSMSFWGIPSNFEVTNAWMTVFVCLPVRYFLIYQYCEDGTMLTLLFWNPYAHLDLQPSPMDIVIIIKIHPYCHW